MRVSAVTYSSANSAGLAAFPGGFRFNEIVIPAGISQREALKAVPEQGPGTFVTGGFAQFSVADSQGNAIKRFDKPVTARIALAAGAVNPETQEEAKVGSSFPVFSYEESTGRWIFETNGVVKQDADSLYVEFQTTHLSYWNLDYVMQGERRCKSATIFLSRTPGDNTDELRVEVAGTAGNRFLETLSVSDNVIALQNAPRVAAKVTVFRGSLKVGEVTTKQLCAGVEVPVTIPAAVPGSANVTVKESCANGSNVRDVPTYLTVRSESLGAFRWGFSTNGAASFPGLQAGSYAVDARNPRTGIWVRREFAVTANTATSIDLNFTMPCNTTSGGG